jgi:hypothetical protein
MKGDMSVSFFKVHNKLRESPCPDQIGMTRRQWPNMSYYYMYIFIWYLSVKRIDLILFLRSLEILGVHLLGYVFSWLLPLLPVFFDEASTGEYSVQYTEYYSR